MKLLTQYIHLDTEGKTSQYNISPQVQALIKESKLQEGQACIFGIGSTTGITTIEYEPGLVNQDVREMFEHFAPYQKNYLHNQTWGDYNGASHLRSFLVGTSLNVPFSEGQLILGTWQQIVFVDFDTRPRRRRVVVQLMGQ